MCSAGPTLFPTRREAEGYNLFLLMKLLKLSPTPKAWWLHGCEQAEHKGYPVLLYWKYSPEESRMIINHSHFFHFLLLWYFLLLL